MSATGTAMMATPAAGDLLDVRDFPDRDALIGFLVVQCRWPTAKVGAFFGLSGRQTRRIAHDEQVAQREAARNQAEPLTTKEATIMVRDYRSDPYTTAAERAEAEAWLKQTATCRGIEDFAGYQATASTG